MGGLKVAVVIIGHEGGGIRRFLLTQCAHAANVGINFEYVCLQPGPLYEELRNAGARAVVIGGFMPTAYPHGPVLAFLRWLLPGGGFGGTLRAVRRYLREGQSDIVYSHFLHTHIVCGLAAARTPISTVGQVHGMLNRTRLFGLTRIAYSLALMLSLDRMVMISRTAFDSLWPPVRRTARMIYNGLDSDAIKHAAQNVSKVPRRLILVGRLVPGKKIDCAIRSLHRLVAAGYDCSLDIAGGPADDSNPYFTRLVSLVEELALRDRVRFLGSLDDPLPCIAAAEILVNCSTAEGFGIVVPEAMLCRTPVVVADRGAPAELVDPGRTGLHFRADDPTSLADAVRRLFDDDELRRQLSLAACMYARELFDITVHMRALRALFEERRRT